MSCLAHLVIRNDATLGAPGVSAGTLATLQVWAVQRAGGPAEVRPGPHYSEVLVPFGFSGWAQRFIEKVQSAYPAIVAEVRPIAVAQPVAAEPAGEDRLPLLLRLDLAGVCDDELETAGAILDRVPGRADVASPRAG